MEIRRIVVPSIIPSRMLEGVEIMPRVQMKEPITAQLNEAKRINEALRIERNLALDRMREMTRRVERRDEINEELRSEIGALNDERDALYEGIAKRDSVVAALQITAVITNRRNAARITVLEREVARFKADYERETDDI